MLTNTIDLKKYNTDLKTSYLQVPFGVLDLKKMISEPKNQPNTIEITLKILEKNNPAYNNTDIEMSFLLSSVSINWKSQAFVYLLKFLMEEPEFNMEYLHETVNLTTNYKSPLVRDISPRLRKEQTLKDFTKKLTVKREELLDDEYYIESINAIHSDSNSLLSLNITLEDIKLDMISKGNSLARLELPLFKAELINKVEVMELKGRIEELKLFELTGYPKTSLSHVKEGGLKLIEGIKNSIEFSYKAFEPSSKLIVNNVASKIKVDIEKLEVLWLQQPMMRIIDFINEEIVGVLTNDYKTPEPIKEDSRYLMYLFKKPKFSNIEIKLVDTLIILKAKPQDCEALMLNVREIKIENLQEKTQERFSSIPTNILKRKSESNNDLLYLDCYSIGLYGCRLSYANNSKAVYYITNGSKPLVLELFIEKIYMCDECVKIYQDEYIIDKTMKVLASIELVDFRFIEDSYQYFMKVMTGNMSYDDGMDMEFSNKTIEQLKAPKSNIYILYIIYMYIIYNF